MPYCPHLYRLGLTEADLATGAFMTYLLPPPDAAPYQDHTEAESASDGGEELLGYDNVTISWNRLPANAATQLKRLVIEAAGTDGEGFLYLTVSRANGSYPGADWIDIKGHAHIPKIVGPADLVGQLDQLFHDSVQLVVNNVTILNDPSIYSVE